MAKVEPIGCPRCGGKVKVNQSAGGRGTGELTSYSADCEKCGLLADHFGNNGRLDNATRDYNRWAREYAEPVAKSSITVRSGYGAYDGGASSKQPVAAVDAIRSKQGTGKYLVSGYCLVPMKAETVVEAESPEQALAIAKAQWKRGPRTLIVPGTDDEGSACDWRPTAELQAN